MTKLKNKCQFIGLALAFVVATHHISSVACDEQQQEPQPQPQSGCNTAATGNVHEQLMKLSQMIDPSGRLSKMISDFHPAPNGTSGASSHEGHNHGLVGPVEPVKRSTEAEQKQNFMLLVEESAPAASIAPAPQTTTPAPPTGAPASSPSSSESTTTTSTTTTVAPTAGNTTAPAVATSAPNVTTPTEASNVTVNVFLQLVADVKTEELVSTRRGNQRDSALLSAQR